MQKKLMLLASFRACNYTDEADTMDLLTILDYVNDKMEMFKKAIAVLKRGGTNHEVLSVF